MPFLTETEPPRGVPLAVLPAIRRVVAKNPSVMTYHGTNTYLIEAEDGLTVIDPGPKDEQHVRDVIAAAGAVPIRRIVVTHTHSDHSGAVKALKEATGAPVYGYKTSGTPKFKADIALDDGDVVAGLQAVFTPGHALDHLSFEYRTAEGQKILFSGDHVMSWSSSIVNPPDGVMQDYYRSLEVLLGRDESLYLPGHGPALPEPRDLVAELLAHRQHREASILQQLAQHSWSIEDLSKTLYAKTNPWLIKAAERNVLAHLLKLLAEGKAVEIEPPATASETEQPMLGPPDGSTPEESSAAIEQMRRDPLRWFAASA